MSIYNDQIDSLQFQLEAITAIKDLQNSEKFSHAEPEMTAMMLEQAARFSQEFLAELAARGDVEGCKLEDGLVSLPTGSSETYQQWCELGFPTLGIPMEHEGMGFPLTILSAIQELMDGANLGFGMLTINLRCAAMALIANASEEIKERWLAGLVSGQIASTIAISEPQAGSDAGRIRTSASQNSQGEWRINGSKIWISYGDHDATSQIIHLVLARVPGDAIGSRGLGLFVVPKHLADSEKGRSSNGVNISRIEHKMGLHNSPTCVMEFENSLGYLIGEAEKGIQNLFVMMNAMRLAVAIQGSAVANSATLQAIAYANERPQGGAPDKPAVSISTHPDVKRMLLEMTAESELIRALALKTASYLDLAETGTADQCLAWRQLGELLLPVAKTVCSETAFRVSNQAIQVMGGYGYTNDYPVERMARDIRVASIYEGTSGIQALDFFKRKVLADDGATLGMLIQEIRSYTGPDDASPFGTIVNDSLAIYEQCLAGLLSTAKHDRQAVLGGTYDFLQLTGLLMHGHHARVLHAKASQSSSQQRLKAALELYAHDFMAKFSLYASRSGQPVSQFDFL